MERLARMTAISTKPVRSPDISPSPVLNPQLPNRRGRAGERPCAGTADYIQEFRWLQDRSLTPFQGISERVRAYNRGSGRRFVGGGFVRVSQMVDGNATESSNAAPLPGKGESAGMEALRQSTRGLQPVGYITTDFLAALWD